MPKVHLNDAHIDLMKKILRSIENQIEFINDEMNEERKRIMQKKNNITLCSDINDVYNFVDANTAKLKKLSDNLKKGLKLAENLKHAITYKVIHLPQEPREKQQHEIAAEEIGDMHT